MYQLVRPAVISKALKWLKKENKLFTNVQENDNWEADWENDDEELWTAMVSDPTENASEGQSSCSSNEPEGTVSEKLSECHVQDLTDSICASQAVQPESEEDRLLHEDQTAANRDAMTKGLPFESCFHVNNIEAHIVNIAPGEDQSPLPIYSDPVFEEGCNPDKYPYGSGGLGHQRKVKITPKKFFVQRVLDVDGRFVRDPQYLNIAQYAAERKNVRDQITIALRKVTGKQIQGKTVTAGLLKNNYYVRELMRNDQAYKFLKDVRGSPAYWQKVFYDVLAMVRQLGCPTWFLSLSAADMQWPELFTLIAGERGRRLTEEDISNLSWNEKCVILRSNPVTAAPQFKYRVDNFFSLFLKSNANPLGKLTDYFIRIEFQGRGSPHAHALLWIENAPTIDVQTDEEVCKFVDQYITCSAHPADTDLQNMVHVKVKIRPPVKSEPLKLSP